MRWLRRVVWLAATVGLGVVVFELAKEDRAPSSSVSVAPLVPTPVEDTPVAPAVEKPAPSLEDPFCGETNRKLVFVEKTRGTRRWVEAFADGVTLGTQERRATEPTLNELEVWNALEDPEQKLAAYRKAVRANPDDGVTGWFFVRAARHDGELDEVIPALQAFSRHFPIPEAQRLEALLGVARDVQRGHQRVTSGGVRLDYPPEVLTGAQASQLVGELASVLDEAARWLDLPRRKTLSAVVYADRSDLLAVTCAPTWAGGLYDGTLRLVAAKHPLGVELRTVRHEAVHAQLRTVAHRAPLWFHEGLARAFEHSPPPKNAWSLMVKNRSWIPFSSLDGSLEAFADDDASLAYAQSYAMVEFLRDCGGGTAIARAIDAFDAGAKTPAVLAQVCQRGEVSGADLLRFIERRMEQ